MLRLQFEYLDFVTLIIFLVIFFFPTFYKNTQMFKTVKIQRGKGWVTQYIVFENKRLFSIYIFNWHSTESNYQDRYHSHAFNSLCFRLSGSYTEESINPEITKIQYNPFLRYLPRNHIHRIIRAEKNSLSVVFTGPWAKHWWEYFPKTQTWVQYSHGRQVVMEQKEYPQELIE